MHSKPHKRSRLGRIRPSAWLVMADGRFDPLQRGRAWVCNASCKKLDRTRQ